MRGLKQILRRCLSKCFFQMEDWIIEARRNYSKRVLTKKMNNVLPLTINEKQRIATFWRSICNNRKCTRLYNLDYYGVYNKYKRENESIIDYIPDDFYYCYADTYFTNYHTSIKLDNKNMYELYFHDVCRPECIIRKVDGVIMDSSYQVIDKSVALSLCSHCEEVVVKKAIDSDGGHGVRFIKECWLNEQILEEVISSEDNFIVQSVIKQHPALAEFNAQSVNTIRIMTLIFDGKVNILSSVFRMGVNGVRVDNASSGGIVCGINSDGSLKDIGFDASANKYLKHPQGKEFANTIIPSYHKCVEIAARLAPRFNNYTKLISWDFAIDASETPILIEANFTGGQLDFHQLCNGPIWGDMTHDVLSEVISNSKDVKKRL